MLWHSRLKHQRVTLASIWAPVRDLAIPLPIQLSAMPWKSSRRGPKCLGPCTRVGDLEEAPGSWLLISALTIEAILEVNQQMADLSLSFKQIN